MRLKALVIVMSVFAIQAQAETLNYKGKSTVPDAEGNSVCRVEVEADENMNPVRVELRGYFVQEVHPHIVSFIFGARSTKGVKWDRTRTHKDIRTDGTLCSWGQDNCFEMREEGDSFLFHEKYIGGAGSFIKRDLNLKLTLKEGAPLSVSATEQIEEKGLMYYANKIQTLTCENLVLVPTEE